MKNTPLVSVIIPIHNTPASMLRRCVESIIAQEGVKIQLILVDDGSSSCSTKKTIARYRDRASILRSKESHGVSMARNRGLEVARGQYVLFIDSDDYIGGGFIEKQLRLMTKDVSVVYSAKLIECNRKIRKKWELDKKELYFPKDIEILAKNDYFFACPGALIKRSRIKGDVTFDEGMKFGEDIYFMAKIIRNSCVMFQPEAHYYYVQNPNSVTHDYSIKSLDAYLNDSFRLIAYLMELYPAYSKYQNDIKKRKIEIAVGKVARSSEGRKQKIETINCLVKKYKHLIKGDNSVKWRLLKNKKYGMYLCLAGMRRIIRGGDNE